jgi:F-type H+-transporting ATPase subunit b
MSVAPHGLLGLLLDSAPPPEAHAPQLIDVDGTVFVQLGLFLVLVVILTKLLWKPYLRVRTERVARVDGYRKEAQRMETDAAARLAKAEAELGEARRIGSGDRATARAEARVREQELLAAAQADAQRALGAARTKLDAVVATERTRIEAGARDIALQAARRILGREVAS